MLTCIRCGEKVKRTSGSQKWCSDCSKVATRERKARQHAKNFASRRESDKRYLSANRQKISDRNARWRAENREYEAERHAAYQSENLHFVRRNRRKQLDRDKAVDASRNNASWTAAEDAVVMSWTYGLRELGAALGRTRGSVRNRRVILRKRAAEQESREGVKA